MPHELPPERSLITVAHRLIFAAVFAAVVMYFFGDQIDAAYNDLLKKASETAASFGKKVEKLAATPPVASPPPRAAAPQPSPPPQPRREAARAAPAPQREEPNRGDEFAITTNDPQVSYPFCVENMRQCDRIDFLFYDLTSRGVALLSAELIFRDGLRQALTLKTKDGFHYEGSWGSDYLHAGTISFDCARDRSTKAIEQCDGRFNREWRVRRMRIRAGTKMADRSWEARN